MFEQNGHLKNQTDCMEEEFFRDTGLSLNQSNDQIDLSKSLNK